MKAGKFYKMKDWDINESKNLHSWAYKVIKTYIENNEEKALIDFIFDEKLSGDPSVTSRDICYNEVEMSKNEIKLIKLNGIK